MSVAKMATEKLYDAQVGLAASLASVEIVDLFSALSARSERSLARLGAGIVARWQNLRVAVEEFCASDHVLYVPVEPAEAGLASALAALVLADILRGGTT